ncbi:sensor histidine kinase [Paenibacillus nasutitermitis]|uniref:histidine kinase n=1 Tax=Paenibacillus nasutitermitis TaxID=1652958 RepID=A0A916Z3Y9_9BACL|nr:HAMP domain-containing sensor histidine kinase [Paenibacillus nasutitermitis]GGD74654.1 two-component sensor histidine kinase [Paenibacillus nasutitermitis]
MSIRLRLTLWYSVVLAATLIAFGVAVYFFVNYNAYSDMKDRINAQTSKLAGNISFDGADLDLNGRVLTDNQLYIQLINYKNSNHLQQTTNLSYINMKLPFPKSEEMTGKGGYYDNINVSGNPFLVYQQPLYSNVDNSLIGLLQVAAYSGREESLLNNLRTILVFSSVAALLIAFTVGLFLARQALRPIENVIQASNKIQHSSDLSVRIPREGPNDEMGRLTDTLNNMLGRLETTYNVLDDAYKAQRRFVSDASHELRTPLTTIRGNIELLERMWLPALAAAEGRAPADEDEFNRLQSDTQRLTISREAMQDIAGEAKRMSSLVNDLLALARADAGYEMEKTIQPLLPLVEDVARRAQLLPRSAEWRIGNLMPLEGIEVAGHADFLRQLFFIFVENAFKYTSEGYVEISAVRASNQAGVIIRDTGIGMDNKEIPHIFERFYRADESRGQTSGTGLGLSIAKWIIDEHGGSVEVSTRVGEGTTFIVWLPIAFLDRPIQV